MTTYADPTRCPDCRAELPAAPRTCPACSLPLSGATATSLFTTLQEADRLLGVLRRQRQPVSVGAPVPVDRRREDGDPILDTRVEPPLPGPRLHGASVPKILLSLGALCLLVAAAIFLAVAWSWLGVGGRTTVLITLTGAAIGVCLVTARRGLRMAAESLATVGLGLVAVDIAGIRHAGWFVPAHDSSVVVLAGALVATTALLLLVATSTGPLVAPAVVAPVAVLVGGLAAEAHTEVLLPLVLTLAVLLGAARVGAVLPSRPFQVTAVVVGAIGWTLLVVAAVSELGEVAVTVPSYVGHLGAWPLLAAVGLAAVVGPAGGVRGPLARTGYAVAGLTATYAVLMPVLDNGPTAAMAGLTAASLAWVSVVLVARRPLAIAALLPLAGALLPPVVAAILLARHAGVAVLTVGAPFSQAWGVRTVAGTMAVSPLLLVPVVLTAAAAGCAAVRLWRPIAPATCALAVGGAGAIGTALTLPLYDVPLALVVGMLLAAAAGSVVMAQRLAPAVAEAVAAAGLALGLGAALLALPSDVMVSTALFFVCAAAGYLATGSRPGRTGALLCFPIAFAGLVWSAGNVVGLDEQLRALPVLVVLGAMVVWKPEPELEAASLVDGTLASAAAVLLAPDLDVSLAVHLTAAGVAVTASSIVNPSRRLLSWPGGLLLAAATWVRLAGLGVHAPEAYTLPSALVLTAVAIRHLRRHDSSATLTVLAPGLVLATVPSLVATLHDPYSLRALLLGVACLGLTVGGAINRWSAPLVVGAVTGSLLVLRELAPYAAHVPSWLTIGAAGALLLAVGITWESRMDDVRRASRYVGALR